jgi:photosystem II stability/assembly factor-like uncharacterized protein
MNFKKSYVGLFILFTILNAGWVQQHSGTHALYDIDFPPTNINIGFACGANSFLLKTTRGGTSWEQIREIEPSGNFNAICFPADESTGFIACDSGNIQITQDGGVHWEKVNVGVGNNLYGIHFKNNDTGLVAGAGGIVMKTVNRGRNWENVSPQFRTDFYDVYYLNQDKFYAVGDSGTIALTTDRGRTWQTQSSNVTSRLLGTYFLNVNTGWIVGAGGTCLKKTFLSATWEPVSIPLPPNTDFYSVIFASDLITCFICGTFGRIAKSTDGGNTWETTTNLLFNFYRVEFPQDNITGWVCGMSEAIFNTTDGGSTWIEEEKKTQREIANHFTCQPNPFKQRTIIRFTKPLTGTTSVKIFDCSGQLIRTLNDVKNGMVIWDGRDIGNRKVKSGIYLIEATLDGFIQQQQKLILLLD